MRQLSYRNPPEEVAEAGGLPDAPGYRSALDVAARTFELIQKYKTPPIPKAYEVLYSYVSNDRELVNERVDEAIERHGLLNLYDIDQIHSDYFSYSEAMQQRQDETAGGMETELSNLMDVISLQMNSTQSYSRSLDMAAVSIANCADPEHLLSTIKVLLSENQRVREESERLASSLEISRDTIVSIKESLASAREEGLRDALTGLRNRRHFDKAIAEEIERATDEGTPLSLCIADLDHFKRVNDEFGHPTGDAVLRLVGALLSENLKGRDIPVRYGGEEFAIILPKTNIRSAERLADRIRQQLSEKRLVLTENRQQLGMITASFGIAEWMPGESDSDIIARADAMLYQAKKSGRNKVVCDTAGVVD